MYLLSLTVISPETSDKKNGPCDSTDRKSLKNEGYMSYWYGEMNSKLKIEGRSPFSGLHKIWQVHGSVTQ